MESLLNSIALRLGLPGVVMIGSIAIGKCCNDGIKKNALAIVEVEKDQAVLTNEIAGMNKKLDTLLALALERNKQ